MAQGFGPPHWLCIKVPPLSHLVYSVGMMVFAWAMLSTMNLKLSLLVRIAYQVFFQTKNVLSYSDVSD